MLNVFYTRDREQNRAILFLQWLNIYSAGADNDIASIILTLTGKLSL